MDSSTPEEKSTPPESPEASTPTDTESLKSESETTYPEGGRDAWLVVFGSWCGLTASLGIYNASGVFEAVISKVLLPETAPSTIGWIFSIYGFVTWLCGVQIGPTFDAMGPRALMLAGSICTLGGIFALSWCTEYYQIILSFSLLTAIGSSLLITPAMACVAHWFMARRGLASGIAFIGAGFGGVLFPLMIQSLLPKVGWGWSLRVMGFILLALCTISVLFCRARVPPRKGAHTTWRDTLPDPKIFLDGSGVMAATTAGVLFTDLAYFIPITYTPSYYLDRQGLAEGGDALSGSAALAYQLLAVLNAASCVGRLVAGHVADVFGRYNTMVVSLLLCTLSVLCLWLPDILTSGHSSSSSTNNSPPALFTLFIILFGFCSGSNVSLTPICLGQLCDTRDYGRYYASCYTAVAFGVLSSIPIAGSLLDAVDIEGRRKYWGVAVFAGACYVAALVCFVWVRGRVVGWDVRTRW
ncbi:major facilitator superfamily domain-containing protein [Aspergillus pseudoustus]|uniref:Major facilitator superfamily domain-containing protein n=1 Tax=Aspergillus pseudoustus TaxID=1810923 RepID=A0ABR4J724_9EURO